MTIYDAIERIAIFEKASPKMKSKIISYAILKKYSEQQNLFREREQVESIYLLVSGNVILYRYNHQGNRKVVFVCGKGEILNEVILEQEIASISCQTLVESIVLVIQRNHFLELLEDDTLARAIICSEAEKIRRLYRQLSNTTNRSNLTSQVAAKLWKLGRDFGEVVDDGMKVKFELSITLLADMVGAKRESTSRVIKSLKEEGLLEIQKGYFIIKDMKGLLDHAHE